MMPRFAVRAAPAATLVIAMTVAGCGSPPPVGRVDRVVFADRAADTGLLFVHDNGMSGEMFMPEIMGPGIGLLDVDNDGDLDVFLPQGHAIGAARSAHQRAQGGRLFRNDLSVGADGRPVLRFTDITEASGITATGYGMGVAAGDFDNDGWTDLYLTNVGSNQLWRNTGHGRFVDASTTSGVDDPGWSVSAAFVDYDRDGWLDLFVGNYLNFSPEKNVACRTVSGTPDYCAPFVYPAQPSRLFRNQRNGTFADVTVVSGLSREYGAALGVSTADFDGDGWVDIFVANDLQPNQLWINQRDGTFRNTGLLAGVAVGMDGQPKSSMGVDAGDFDNDGDEDLFITELTGQGADLYVNDGAGTFNDHSARSGLRNATLPYTGFGTAWIDTDNDSWLDLVTVNGLVMGVAPGQEGQLFPFAQLKQLLRNLGDGRFADETSRAGEVFARLLVGRGAAFGDLDNDGDPDVVVGNAAGPTEVLINEQTTGHHWVGLRLVGGEGRDQLGARVGIVRAGEPVLWRRARADGSYASANDPRVLVGLGSSRSAVSVRVIWPDGVTEHFGEVASDRYTTLTRGTGQASER